MLIEKEDAIKAVCEACYMYKYIGEHYKECKYYPCDDVTALESVSEAPSGDLISRQDAIEELESAFYFNSEDCRTAIGCIKALPSAEATCATCADRAMCIMSAPDGNWKACKDYRPSAEAVQGEWIRKYDDKVNCYWYECDQCGSRPPKNEYTKQEWFSNFCPNCGARMKGGEDDNA